MLTINYIMAQPLVFSFMPEQRRFLFAMFCFLTFFATISAGLMLSLNSAISQLHSQLGRTGIIQVMDAGNIDAARRLLTDSSNYIQRSREIGKAESKQMLERWLPSADALAAYIPVMFEVEAKTTSGLNRISERARAVNLRFIPSINAGPERRTARYVMTISGAIFAIVMTALILGIIHSARNIILLHRREIEILSNLGATPTYIAWQIQKTMAKIAALAVAVGVLLGWIILFGINAMSRLSKIGLLSNMNLTGADYALTAILGLVVIAIIAVITGKTTLRILNK